VNRRLAIGLGTTFAVVAAAGGVAVLAWPSSTPAESAGAGITTIPPDAGAKTPAVHASVDSLALAAGAAGTAELRQRSTKAFSMVSVSWTDPAAAPAGAVQVRTRSVKGGKWSAWRDLAVAEAAADLPAEASRAHGATDAYWTGRSNGVAARIVRKAGAAPAALPAGLQVNLIDPDATTAGTGGGSGGGQGGGEPAPTDSSTPPGDGTGAEPTGDPSTGTANPPVSDSGTTEATPTGTPETTATTAPPSTTPAAPATTSTTTVDTPTSSVPVSSSTGPVVPQLPPYVSRAGWGADEALVKNPISIASQAKMVWVHHTGFGNQYTCAQSASVIRGIQANDVNVKGLDDMGYNFLVDNCGTLFEGRKGGVTKAVIGAHTVGFNTGSVGVALLGDTTTMQPSAAAQTTIAQVAAARLGAYGFDPASTATMTEGSDGRKWPINTTTTFPRISGHKDGEISLDKNGKDQYLTECPGNILYGLLPSIRAQSTITGFSVRSLGGGRSVGGTFYVRTAVTVSWNMTTPTANLSRFELLRDGRVAATLPASARSGSLSLSAGVHGVAVRAVHVSGTTAVTPSYRVIADVTAPTFPAAPAPSLRTGTYGTGSAPVTAAYRAADNVKVYTVTATKPASATLSPTGTAWNATMRPGVNTSFTLTARDPSGNARTVTVVRKANLLAETKAKRGGTWTTKTGGSYLSGKALSATKKNAKLTYTFTGRSAALLFARGAKTGKAYVYLDGKKVATIDTKQTKTAYGQALWVKALSAKKHTVAIVVAGTGGRPTVVSDGLVYIG
jgi:hypothetical protein